MVLHMLGGQEACTEGAMIHKAAVRRYGHKRGTKGAQRVHISRYCVTDDHNCACTHSVKAKPEGSDEVRNCRCKSREHDTETSHM